MLYTQEVDIDAVSIISSTTHSLVDIKGDKTMLKYYYRCGTYRLFTHYDWYAPMPRIHGSVYTHSRCKYHTYCIQVRVKEL